MKKLFEEFAEHYTAENYNIYHVSSGLDAFTVVFDNNRIYMPYIAVIAKDEHDARVKAAQVCGQKLEDQDTNPSYENYVSEYVEFIRKF